jgi:hypothetical protein
MRAMDQAVVGRAMERLADDLRSGDWDRRHGHLRDLPALDLGYRIVLCTAQVPRTPLPGN